ncbi:MAG: hypothetical protein ACLF0G_13475 [Candidatus Brocadiia bacterium]
MRSTAITALLAAAAVLAASCGSGQQEAGPPATTGEEEGRRRGAGCRITQVEGTVGRCVVHVQVRAREADLPWTIARKECFLETRLGDQIPVSDLALDPGGTAGFDAVTIERGDEKQPLAYTLRSDGHEVRMLSPVEGIALGFDVDRADAQTLVLGPASGTSVRLPIPAQ